MRVRNAREDAPYVWLLTPTGRPVKHPVDKMLSSKVVKIDQGRPTIRPLAAEKGWRLLKDACTPDEWTAWLAFSEEERKAGGRLRIAKEYRPACMQVRSPARPIAREYVPPGTVPMAGKPKASKGATAPQNDAI